MKHPELREENEASNILQTQPYEFSNSVEINDRLEEQGYCEIIVGMDFILYLMALEERTIH